MLRVSEILEATKGRLTAKGHDAAIRSVSIDSRSTNPKDAFIAIKGNNFDGHDFIDKAIKKGASCVVKKAGSKVKSKTANVTFIEVDDTIKALGDIAGFQRKKFNIPVIAVTGSNGKTTTKEMAACVLSAKYKVLKNEGTKNNNIGLPLTLLSLKPAHDIAVLEVGTNHPGEVEYLTRICRPNIGIITNVGPSHLEYFRDLRGVFREKYGILKNLDEPCIGILNADDNLLRKRISVNHKKAVILSFGLKTPCDFSASVIKNSIEGVEFRVNQKYKFTLNTPGYYNIYNALAAITAARIFGIAYEDIISRLDIFDFPKSRLKILELNKAVFIDDTYNSNPLSLRQALETLGNLKAAGRKIFVMGDMLELGDRKKYFHYHAGRQAAHCCDVLVTVGNLSREAARAAVACRMDAKNIFCCKSTAEAHRVLFKELSPKKGDVVLAKGSRSMKMEEILKG